MSERWDTGRLIVPTHDTPFDVRRILDMLNPVRVEIEDTGAADSVNTVRHNLGRIPNKIVIARQEVPSTTPVAWYRNSTDAEWTDIDLTLRFNVANSRVLLEIS